MEADALEAAQREAAALRRSRAIQRELLSSLSHELRTPLTAIHGYASTLCQPDLTWDVESTERFLNSIAAESARMERLVGHLLDSTAIESGSLQLQADWCDLRLVTEAAIRCVHDDGSIRSRIDDDLEPVWADHDRLEQVLVNLLENAVTHGGSDAGVDVTIARAGAGRHVEIEVRDHGRGLPDALAGRIFQPHVRGDDRHRRGRARAVDRPWHRRGPWRCARHAAGRTRGGVRGHPPEGTARRVADSARAWIRRGA